MLLFQLHFSDFVSCYIFKECEPLLYLQAPEMHCSWFPFILQVYFYLLKMYLDPPSPSTLGVSASQGIVPKPNMNAALRLMKEHAPKIDTSKVCFLVNKCYASTQCTNLHFCFIMEVFQRPVQQSYCSQVFANFSIPQIQILACTPEHSLCSTCLWCIKMKG